jgi:hypothetical protein
MLDLPDGTIAAAKHSGPELFAKLKPSIEVSPAIGGILDAARALWLLCRTIHEQLSRPGPASLLASSFGKDFSLGRNHRLDIGQTPSSATPSV